MPIEPDDKNWTWVLERTCTDCGFDAAHFPATDVARATEALGPQWRVLLADPRARTRPNDHTWSAVEYACHVRDVCRLYLVRLDLMLLETAPTFENWDQDVTAVAERYDLQDPAEVAAELAGAADMLGARFATVAGAAWERTGLRSDGALFTIDTFARYFLHDPIHHVWDVQQGYTAIG